MFQSNWVLLTPLRCPPDVIHTQSGRRGDVCVGRACAQRLNGRAVPREAGLTRLHVDLVKDSFYRSTSLVCVDVVMLLDIHKLFWSN